MFNLVFGHVVVFGDEWSPTISETAEETNLLDVVLDYIIGQQEGYSICAREIRNRGKSSMVIK